MIRDMREADIAEVAPLHREAFRGSLGPALGDRYVRAFLRWFLRYQPSVCLLYDFAGDTAGYVFGAPVDFGPQLNRDLLPTVALAALTHPQIVLHKHFWNKARGRLRWMWNGGLKSPAQPVAPAPVETFALTGIGVSPRHRNRKIGHQLVAAFEERVAARGFRRVALDVYADNAPARHLYESMGWRVCEEAGNVLVYDKLLAAGRP